MDCNYSAILKDNISKPNVLISWDGLSPLPSAFKLVEIIESYGGSIKKINYFDPEIDCSKLKSEVDTIIYHLKNHSNTQLKTKSIANSVLKIAKEGNYPEIAKISDQVKAAMENTRALLLPGGEDVRPFFYGQSLESKTAETDDFRRDIYEFTMLDNADLKKIPVLGVCRGLQITNIWYGGSLKQHIEGHVHVMQKYLPIESSQELYQKSVIGKIFQIANHSIIGYSIHHQAVDLPAENLTVISKDQDGIIKALECIKNRFIVLLQWHPERVALNATEENQRISKELSQENYLFFKYFVEAAKRVQA